MSEAVLIRPNLSRFKNSIQTPRSWPILILTIAMLINGCTTTPIKKDDVDPFEGFNRKIYRFNVIIDENIAKPIADGYTKITPQAVQNRVTDFFENLFYINVFLNQFLQGKIEQGLLDTARFVFNSTFGVFGLFDIATGLGLKENEEDFGQTLAVWGVAQGPYLMLPFLGPFTLRKTPDLALTVVTNPLFYVDNLAVTIPVTAVGFIDLRARAEGAIQFVNEAAIDPYLFMREAFLQRREYLIFDGNPPVDDLFEELEEESEEALDLDSSP